MRASAQPRRSRSSCAVPSATAAATSRLMPPGFAAGFESGEMSWRGMRRTVVSCGAVKMPSHSRLVGSVLRFAFPPIVPAPRSSRLRSMEGGCSLYLWCHLMIDSFVNQGGEYFV